MDPSAWIALAGLAFVVLAQMGTVAFLLGGLFARVGALEKKPDNDCKAELTGLAEKVGALSKAMDEFKGDIREDISAIRNALMTGRPKVRAVE